MKQTVKCKEDMTKQLIEDRCKCDEVFETDRKV